MEFPECYPPTYEWYESFLLILGQPFLTCARFQTCHRSVLLGKFLRHLVLELAYEMMRPEFSEPGISAIYLLFLIFFSVAFITIAQSHGWSKAHKIFVETCKGKRLNQPLFAQSSHICTSERGIYPQSISSEPLSRKSAQVNIVFIDMLWSGQVGGQDQRSGSTVGQKISRNKDKMAQITQRP